MMNGASDQSVSHSRHRHRHHQEQGQGQGQGHEQPLCHIVTPVGMLGYGFDEAQTSHELAALVATGVPTAIILDSGSTDSGPEKLALGSMTCPRSSYVQDLTKLLRLAHRCSVPLIIGSAGGDGTDAHVAAIGGVLDEIAAQNTHYKFKVVSLFSGIDKSTVIERLRAGRITGCGPCVPPLTEENVNDSPNVVAQMGSEPFVEAMAAHTDFGIILGGRTYDPAPYTAWCVYQLRRQHGVNGHDKNNNKEDEEDEEDDEENDDVQARRYGGFVHMGKIMECGGVCSKPKSHGAVATVYPSGVFEIRPTAPDSRCTPISVAAHALYENSRPDVLCGPGGELHLNDASYEQLADGRTVMVRGSRYVASRAAGLPYQFKLEAARVAGYRSICLGSVRDYILISQLDALLARVRSYVDEQHPEARGTWDLDFHTYGKGQFTADGPGEVFIVTETLAPTQLLANSLASKARIAIIHAPYQGQKATAGNLAFGIGGRNEIDLGPCAEFSVYHLMELDPGEQKLGLGNASKKTHSLLRMSVTTIGKGTPPSGVEEKEEAEEEEGGGGKREKEKDSAAHTSTGPKAHSIPRTLSDLCHVLRSKNAGPYEITIDAMFVSEAAYRAVKDSGLLSADAIAQALGVSPHDAIIWMGFYDPARAFKVTIPRVRAGRRTSAGGFMENDVHGSQQHLGLANLVLPESLRRVFEEEP